MRNACALAVLLNRPLTISKIRAGRDKPGLRPQHLTAIELITAMAEGQLEGAAVNSTSLTLKPRELKPGQFVGDTRTAGSTCLLLQVSLPCALFAPGPCTLVFKGGTNASAAPQIDYAEHVFLPTVRRMGAEVSMRIVRRGYHPQGGGEVVVETQSLQGRGLQPLDLTDFGQIQSVQGLTFASAKLPAHIAERMAQTARKLLRKALPTSTPIEVEAVAERPERGIGAGCGITVVCRTSTGCLLGGSALGERGKSAETVAEAAVDELLATVNAGACVDEWLLDQLVIYAALAVSSPFFFWQSESLNLLWGEGGR